MVNKQCCSALFPGSLWEQLLFRACPKFFHCKCFYGNLRFKTEQLYWKDVFHLWNILPLLSHWAMSQTKCISLGTCHSEYSEEPKVGILWRLSLTAEAQFTKISNWCTLWNLIQLEKPARRGQWRYEGPQGISISKHSGLLFEKTFFKSQGKDQ